MKKVVILVMLLTLAFVGASARPVRGTVGTAQDEKNEKKAEFYRELYRIQEPIRKKGGLRTSFETVSPVSIAGVRG